MADPFEILNTWIQDEASNGAPNPKHAVLSTVGLESIPHGRVVAIKEITNNGIIFFTQKNTKKVVELYHNVNASLTFWFELSQKQVTIDVTAQPLSKDENEKYWKQYPKPFQMRFYSYAPTSAQPIQSKSELQLKLQDLQKKYNENDLPVSDLYCGFRLMPTRFVFYTFRLDELSDVIEYHKNKDGWCMQILSP